MYSLSKMYHETPAALIGLTDEVAGFCLNRGVHLFGTSLENEVQEATSKLKKRPEIKTTTHRIMSKWLARPGEVIKGQFRDPMSG